MSSNQNFNGSGDEAMQDLIGKQLRAMYDDILSEPVPDKIVELLVKLDDIKLPPLGGGADLPEKK